MVQAMTPVDPDTTIRAEQIRYKQRQNPRRIVSLFLTLARPYWKYKPGAKLNFLWVIFLGFIRSIFSMVFSFISRDFWTALQHKDIDLFWKQIRLFTIVLLTALPLLVWYSYARERLSLRWREWHTEKLLGDYFAKRNYYDIDQGSTVDNPDQRISQDVHAFTSTSLSLFMTIFLSIFDLAMFSYVLFSIYPKLFVVLILYSSMGTLIALLLGKRLINLNFLQLQKEADFRYSLTRVRENAESIAFYKGEQREKFEATRRFGSAVDNLVDVLIWSRNLAFFTTTYSHIIGILPLSIIAPMYFHGSIELGVVSQSQQAFSHILDDLSLIINEFDRLSEFSAGIDRLGELEEFIYSRFAEAEDRKMQLDEDQPIHIDENTTTQNISTPSDEYEPHSEVDRQFALAYGRQEGIDRFRRLRKKKELTESGIDLLHAEETELDCFITTKITPNDEPSITVKNLTLMTPDKLHRVLFSDLSFKLNVGDRLLIVGPSGTGKSSALRALAGLWQYGHGTITRPALETMFFLPQKPYCTLGSLREQLVYPTPVTESSASEIDLQEALEEVTLADLPERMGGLDEIRDWSNVLSLGEQQRLAFARLLVGKPKLAILDECSSALDIASENRLYTRLRESGTGYISVGHRPTLVQYHDFILRLQSGGSSCTIEQITDNTQVQ